MSSPNQKKLAQKQATSISTRELTQRLSPTDKQIGEVRQWAQEAHSRDTNPAIDDAHTKAEEADANANTRIKNQSDVIERFHIDNQAVGFDQIGNQEIGGQKLYPKGVTPTHLDRTYLTPSQADSRYYTKSEVNDAIDNHGHGEYLTSSEHSSIHQQSYTPFMKYPREERERMMEDRQNLETLLEHGNLNWHEEVLFRNTLNALKLQMDYRLMDAYERHRRFDDPEWAQWADDYKRLYGLDEHFERELSHYKHKRLPDGRVVRMDPHKALAYVDEEGS